MLKKEEKNSGFIAATLYILKEPKFRVSLMQKNFWSPIIMRVKNPIFWKSKTVKHRTIYLSFKNKIKTYNLGKFTCVIFWGGYLLYI
jgi:hypothetical protein